MKRRTHISRIDASSRAKKAWATKHRKYGHQTIVKDKRKHYWDRGNERIRLKHFSSNERARIEPALVAADRILKPDVALDLKHIKKGHVQGKNVLGEYRAAPVVFGHKVSRPSIALDKTVVKPSSRRNPAGVLAHEIGHGVFPGTGTRLPRSAYADYRRSFDYKRRVGKSPQNLQTYKVRAGNPVFKDQKFQKSGDYPRHGLKRGKTRQSVDAGEDFAETFRGLTGLPVADNHYWSNKNIRYNTKRLEHMHQYHVK